jgi:REP element-mobilizing transposase RayT
MPRQPRAEEPGAIYHVYARGAARQDIFRDDLDRRRYLRLLSQAVRWRSWYCLSYCLMSNHVHLVLETPQPNLSAGMMRFHGDYAKYFNRRHSLSGHVFQGRYEAVRVRSDRQLWTAVAYVVNNPVAAGLCAGPDDWPWSSHTAIATATAPDWLADWRLLGYLSQVGGDPRQRYVDEF